MAVLALVLIAFTAWQQRQEQRAAIDAEQRSSLRGRLHVEQRRLQVQLGLGNRMQARRLVSEWGRRPEITHAYLVDPELRVFASMRRASIGKPLGEALGGEAPAIRTALLDAARRPDLGVHVQAPDAPGLALVGRAAVVPDYRLIVYSDLEPLLAMRTHEGRGEIWRVSALILGLAVLVAAVLHLLWFRRARRLVTALRAIGSGDLGTRAGLAGRDEFAEIGAAVDQMAGSLQFRHTRLEQLTSILARSPVVAMEWENSPGWPVRMVSDAISQWGYTVDRVLAGDFIFADLIHPGDRPRIQDEVARHLAEGPDDYRQEYRLKTADGRWVWVDDRTWLTRDAGGRVLTIHGVLLDITAQRTAEDELRRINAGLEARVAERTAQLKAANLELEAFSYSVSHDLKAPLRGIDGYSQILLQDYGGRFDDDGRVLLRNVRRGVAQMHGLIEDLLAYSRTERRAFEAQPLGLRELVGDVLESLRPELERCGAVVDDRLPPLSVVADRDGLNMVVRNLLDNALKFSLNAAPPRICLGAQAEGARVVLSVRDNGVGFDMKYHDRIFEIFQRLHRAEDYPGTGVGLALVRKAVQRMGGRVWAESAPGQGACFYVELRK
ncbi:hypothetical protein CCZ27_16485 [Thauera sinica]|nr:hypothetical protein CCZ27_16485 [Thauera sp. K11]